MNYCDSLFNNNEIDPDKTALIDLNNNQSLSFAELRKKTLMLAAWLKKQGIGPGETIGIHLHNGNEMVVVHMAIQFIGAVSCLIDPLAQVKNLDYYIKDTGCRLFITHLEPQALDKELSGLCSFVFLHDVEMLLAKEDLELEKVETMFKWDPQSVSYIYYTSGTTSTPKGVMLMPSNHENFFRICDIYWQPVSKESRHLCFVPFTHGFGSVFLIPLAIRTGAQLYILRSFHPIKVLNAIDKFDITHLYGVPSHYKQILRLPDSASVIKKIKMAFCAAAKLEHQVMSEWKELTGLYLNEGYGLIETTGGTVWRVNCDPRGTGHMGELPDKSLIEVGIMDENFDLLEYGETGEIVIRGKSVMKGYLNKPEENKRVFVDEWFRTGDQGYISSDNQLFMTGRIKDIINIAGIKISPFEVEEVLNQHPAVSQSIVVAAEDNLYGEVVKAYVLKKADTEVTERELIRFASEHLINFQLPKSIVFLDKFPLNNMGKIDRKKLKNQETVNI
ncbi:MAG: acyl--CoA ligase [Spirochaetales bacterium]|nr:acyl--CoA ligase [Spirochaetales bacterium]